MAIARLLYDQLLAWPRRRVFCTLDRTLSSRNWCWQKKAANRNSEHMPNMTDSGTFATCDM